LEEGYSRFYHERISRWAGDSVYSQPFYRASRYCLRKRRCQVSFLPYRFLDRRSRLGHVFFFVHCHVLSYLLSSLAYLTNPSENSFRAYLTEQSFRHHLSQLDDSSDNLQSNHSPYPRYPPKRSNLITPIHSFIDSSPFYFANRASICLRTPKHVFHSFAIFTIAAMIPYSKSCDGENQDAWMISDAWYIGAFGKWWRGGALEAWYQDVIARSKDEESWTSGILSMKRLDILQDHTGMFYFCLIPCIYPIIYLWAHLFNSRLPGALCSRLSP